MCRKEDTKFFLFYIFILVCLFFSDRICRYHHFTKNVDFNILRLNVPLECDHVTSYAQRALVNRKQIVYSAVGAKNTTNKQHRW